MWVSDAIVYSWKSGRWRLVERGRKSQLVLTSKKKKEQKIFPHTTQKKNSFNNVYDRKTRMHRSSYDKQCHGRRHSEYWCDYGWGTSCIIFFFFFSPPPALSLFKLSWITPLQLLTRSWDLVAESSCLDLKRLRISSWFNKTSFRSVHEFWLRMVPLRTWYFLFPSLSLSPHTHTTYNIHIKSREQVHWCERRRTKLESRRFRKLVRFRVRKSIRRDNWLPHHVHSIQWPQEFSTLCSRERDRVRRGRTYPVLEL